MPAKELTNMEKIDRAIARSKEYIHILYISLDRNKALCSADDYCNLALAIVEKEMEVLLSKKAEIESLKSEIILQRDNTEE